MLYFQIKPLKTVAEVIAETQVVTELEETDLDFSDLDPLSADEQPES